MPSTVTIHPDKKIGHKLDPNGTYEADILRSRFNRAGNLELVLTNIRKAKTNDEKLS